MSISTTNSSSSSNLSTTVLTQAQLKQVAQFNHDSQQLTCGEKTAKWTLKVLTMIIGAIAATALGLLLSTLIPLPVIGTGIGMGVVFIATMKMLEKIDKYYIGRATQRALTKDVS
ncbi:MAG: hypothetical protein WCF19_01470 [Chlamydiales bacterium]